MQSEQIFKFKLQLQKSINPLRYMQIILTVSILIWYLILISNILRFKNTNEKLMCYKNYIWNSENMHSRLNDILDDNLLQKSNGKNIFFHLTNCIHDGILRISPR